MTIETRDYGDSDSQMVVTTACSFCETELKDGQSIADHLRNDCPEVNDD